MVFPLANPLLRSSLGYLLSAAVTALAVLVRWSLPGTLSGTPYLAFYPAVVAAAAFGGLGPGLLATIASALCVDYFFDSTPGWVDLGDPVALGRLAIFLAGGLGVSLIAQMQRTAAAREHQRAQELAGAGAETERQRKLLAVTLASIGDGVIVTDPKGRVTFLNGEAERLTGWPGERAAGLPLTSVFNIVNEQTRKPVESPVEKVLRSGTVVALANHTILIARDGREIPIDDSGAPIRQADGAVQGVVLVFRDFTKQKRAEEALRASEARVRLKLESILSPEGDIGDLELADLIDALAIQSLMDTFHTFSGIPMAIIDLKGKVLVGVGWQDICTRFHRVHPETCKHCIESDTQLSAGVPPGEFRRYKCKNNMWDIATPILVGGQHVGNLFTGQFFFEGESVDYDLFRAQARRYEFDEEEYLAALETVPRLSREAVQTGMAFFINLAGMLSRLSYSNVKLARSLVQRDALMEDLAAAKQSAERAKAAADQANEAKTRFLANTSHELRTPMNAILGMTELALDEELSAAVRDYLQTAKSSADSLLALLNDILDFSRIESGKIALESIPFSLRTLLADTTKALSVRAHEKGLEVSCGASALVPDRLVGDPLRLRQILTNLVGNAIKFTLEGEILVHVDLDRQSANETVLRFTVSDTGIGISPQDQERIFAPFMQADTSTTRHFGGTGLGLAITANLVAMMGGQVWLDSRPGKGTTFYFTVHLAPDCTPPADEGQAAPGTVMSVLTPAPARSLRILLAEDTPANQKLVVRILEKRGHKVVLAGNGHEAVARLAQDDYDVVLMDVQMPVMDGFQATAAIRALGDAKAQIPIIAMTAHAMKGDEERCLEAGMDAYIAKPINSRELIQRIEGTIESAPGRSGTPPGRGPFGA